MTGQIPKDLHERRDRLTIPAYGFREPHQRNYSLGEEQRLRL
jgi:hypothetical protein